MRYQIVGRGHSEPLKATGSVVNISSRGLAFHSDLPPQVGSRLKVSLAWPVKLDQCMLRLAFDGTVLRVRGNLVIVSMEHYQFRTAGKSTAAVREDMAALIGSAESLGGLSIRA